MKLNHQSDKQDANSQSAAQDKAAEQPIQQSNQDLIDVINQQQAKITDLINTAQRTRADFENYRKHTEADLARARQQGTDKAVQKLLPIIDVLDSAMATVPAELQDHQWVKGIMAAHKNLDKLMADLNLSRQAVKAGDAFDHNQHDAIMFEDGEGDQEVVADVLRPGYVLGDRILRPAMVKVTKK